MINESITAYHKNTAVSRSRLINIQKCPQYYKWAIDNPTPATADMIIGQAFHKLVLEPEDFDKEFATIPKCDKRTTAGKADFAEWQEKTAGKTAIEDDVYTTICEMKKSLLLNKYAAALVTNGDAEKSFYWTDELTGIECKCRPDYFRKIKDRILGIDLKSCRSAAPEDIPRELVKYGYDLQSAMVTEGLSKHFNCSKDKIDFVFIFVEKTPPYLTNIVQADSFILERGYELMRLYLGQVKECTESGNWYGYNGFSGKPDYISLPPYILKQFNNNKGE